MPCFPLNTSCRPSLENCACRSRNVVRPYDLFVRAYSSFPTRTSVASSSRTTVATTFSRGIAGVGRGRLATCLRIAGSARAELVQAGELRFVAVGAEPRVIPVLLPTPRVAAGRLQVTVGRRRQIHTSVQAGGIARARMRSSAAAPVTRRPFGPT